jgi:Asp-tRNA(Asn)/Glu-tRNA(Gln) amidotransferase A subunit family amidase
MENAFAQAARICDRIGELDQEILAFLPEPGRRDRLERDARSVPGAGLPLQGVPVGVKDIIRVDGLPTRAGSALPPEVFAGPQAPLVDRLRAAGALVAGKTVTAEFAVTAPGPTRNPRNPAHSPGGSSSGSAAAVAAGMVPLAVGTQTVGSVIRPAAYCGVVGFRPTHGRIPVEGVIANAPSFDTVGVFAADVAGVALTASVLCDGWRQALGPGLRPPVLGVPDGPYLARAGAEALSAFEEQVGSLRAAGFPVRRIQVMADFERIFGCLYVINRFEVARTHAEWFPHFGELYREQTAAAICQGQTIGHDDYAKALRQREDFHDRLTAAMSDARIDLWLAPSATGPAPRGLASTGSGVMCLPWSGAGLPSPTLPAGAARNRLPLGLQCVGLPGADEELLARGAVLAAVLPG